MDIFARITKVDVARREVWGRACQEVPDHSGEIFDYAKSKPYFEKWSAEVQKASKGKSLGNLRSMHGNIAAGKLVAMDFNDDECAIDISAKVVDDNEWEKVLEGVHTGFSIGGKYVDKWKEDGLTRYVADPSEISLVDRPCIPTATFFDVIKADGSIIKKQFANPSTGASNMSKKATAAEIAANMVATILAKGVIEPERVAKLINDELELMNKNGVKVTETVDVAAIAKAAEDAASLDNDPAATPAAEPAQAAAAPAQAAPAPEVTKFEGVTLEQVQALIDAALAKVAARDDVDPKEGKDKYGDVEFADEKNKKYPIDNEKHIRAAWNYINKPKNAAKYSAEDLKTIKGKIIAAWKAKIDKDGPPSADDKGNKFITDAELTKRVTFIKNMYTVSSLASLLQTIANMRDGCKSEADWEGDGSELPKQLQDWLAAGVDILRDMVDEETSEMIASGDAAGSGEVAVMAMAQQVENLMKRGAKHSKETMEKLQSMHDILKCMGTKCDKGDGEDGKGDGDGDQDGDMNADKAVKADDLAKVNATLVKVTGDFERVSALLEKSTKDNADLAARLKKLEDTPLPSKGSLKVVAVDKERDGKQPPAEAVVKVVPAPGTHDPAAAQEMIKSAFLERGGVQNS